MNANLDKIPQLKAIVPKNKQLWNEYWLFRTLLKPKQVLHVGVLLNGLDGFLIAQFCFYDGRLVPIRV